MRLTREKIQRMVGSKGSMSSGAAGGGSIGITEQRVNEILQNYETIQDLEQRLDDYVTDSELETTLADYATETWVNNNYISIAFFSRLFQAHGTENNQQTDIDPNDTYSTITSIEAMFGFWTEQYLSALGNSGGGSVSLTLANMGDVSLNNLADGQILVYDATEGKWVNTSASIVGNYLPLTGGTLTGDLFFEGYNNRVFGIKRTAASAGQSIGTNIDIGWDWDNRDGAGAFFRSSEATTNAGDFGFFARNATQLCELLGKADGTLTWGNNPILTSANVKTINGESIYGSGNIVVGGGGSGYLPLTGGTLTNSSFGGALTIKRSTTGGSAIRYSNNNGALGSLGFDASGNLAYWTGSSSAIEDKFILASQTWVNGQFLPLTGGTLTGRLTINASVPDAFVLNRTSAGNVVRMDMAQGGTVYGNLGLDTSHNIILRTTSGSTHTVRLQINTNGNVGIGTTSPNYKLHVNGTLGAGNTSVANLESEGYVSALSDIRKKEVVEYMDGLTIEQIAEAPIIKFTWKERPEDGLQVGSIAQYWQDVLPQSVHTTHDGFLSFAESRAALVGTISNSRELMKHDARLSRIEKLLNINID